MKSKMIEKAKEKDRTHHNVLGTMMSNLNDKEEQRTKPNFKGKRVNAEVNANASENDCIQT